MSWERERRVQAYVKELRGRIAHLDRERVAWRAVAEDRGEQIFDLQAVLINHERVLARALEQVRGLRRPRA